ncbi:MAG TPA: hypothetical protein DCE43_20500 [Planctomycetaceae bacterium]|nr:hypothetical protein [Planctomycetaceae bacterium]HCK53546.1 hypothetical protein [Planctomycetaceae bacterium]|tara:strand:- start:5390 stop:6538 length:1149 start_codon:yes stop_codon:yes gene_type:complete
MRGHCFPILVAVLLLAPSTPSRAEKPARQRRILVNYDGGSTLYSRKGSQGPVRLTAEDLREAIREVSFEGSQVDTVLLCVNAQVMYYPTRVGTMLGSLATPEEKKKLPRNIQQWISNLNHFVDRGIDPWAVMVAEAKRQKREVLLSFRMNDGHDGVHLETRFWRDNKKFHCFDPDQGHTLNYGHKEVRDHMFLLIQEAVRRYDCDGIELDFNRFPILFKGGTTTERIAKMNSFVRRLRTMLDAEGKKRKRRLVLGVRPPTENYDVPATYQGSRKVGCDPVAWARNGWIDFVTVSRFLSVTFDLPVAPWKKLITEVPVYGCIEIVDKKNGVALTPRQYRRAAQHIWSEKADGVYLFNFLITREGSTEPAFEVLNQIGSPDVVE